MDSGEKIDGLRKNMARLLFGKADVIDLTIIALLARGHVLIEDVPGVGKTTLAYALTRSLNASFRRIQFTSDLLPSDILGVAVFDQAKKEFQFKPGPIFANVVLADEINRTTPKTQSALLEAMNDCQVSVDSVTHKLPQPFMVMATQNPLEFHGTHPLPESQMDRFLMRIRIGYPDETNEINILKRPAPTQVLETIEPIMDTLEVLALQRQVEKVRMDQKLVEYLMKIVAGTRACKSLRLGVSPRGTLSLYRAAQARALIEGREYCLPDDIKGLTVPTFAHRVLPVSSSRLSQGQSVEAEKIMEEILDSVPVPL